MKPKISALVSDVDGTLVTDDKILTPRSGGALMSSLTEVEQEILADPEALSRWIADWPLELATLKGSLPAACLRLASARWIFGDAATGGVIA